MRRSTSIWLFLVIITLGCLGAVAMCMAGCGADPASTVEGGNTAIVTKETSWGYTNDAKGQLVQVPIKTVEFNGTAKAGSITTNDPKVAAQQSTSAPTVKAPNGAQGSGGGSDNRLTASAQQSQLNVFTVVGGLLIVAAACFYLVPMLVAGRPFAGVMAIAGGCSFAIGMYINASQYMQFLGVIPAIMLLAYLAYHFNWFGKVKSLTDATARAALDNPTVDAAIKAAGDAKDIVTHEIAKAKELASGGPPVTASPTPGVTA